MQESARTLFTNALDRGPARLVRRRRAVDQITAELSAVARGLPPPPVVVHPPVMRPCMDDAVDAREQRTFALSALHM